MAYVFIWSQLWKRIQCSMRFVNIRCSSIEDNKSSSLLENLKANRSIYRAQQPYVQSHPVHFHQLTQALPLILDLISSYVHLIRSPTILNLIGTKQYDVSSPDVVEGEVAEATTG